MTNRRVQALVRWVREWAFPAAYTGEQRCFACTIVNLVLVALAVGGVAIFSRLAAIGVGIVGTMLIWIRGYVVPYTPRFAPTLVEHLPVEFHDEERRSSSLVNAPEQQSAADSDEDSPLAGDSFDTGASASDDRNVSHDGTDDVLTTLSDADIVSQHGDTFVVDDTFRETWWAAIRDVRNGDLEAAISAATPAANVELVEETENTWYVLTDGDHSVESETWLSPAVAIAEVAAVRTLEVEEIPPSIAPQAASLLRPLLDQCPVCDGDIVATTADHCCGGYGPSGPQEVLACLDCNDYVARSAPNAAE